MEHAASIVHVPVAGDAGAGGTVDPNPNGFFDLFFLSKR